MTKSLLSGILIFGIIQALFFSLLFFTKKNKAVPDKVISSWLFILSINILTVLLSIFIDSNTVKIFQVSFTLVHGAFLYLYVLKLTKENTKFIITDFFHFLPFVISFFVGLLTTYFEVDTRYIINLIAICGIVSGVSYLCSVIYFLKKHSIIIKDRFSFTEKINLNWLINLTIGLFAIWIGGSLAGILLRFFHFNIPIVWLFTIIPVFIFYIGFYGIRQNIIYSPNTGNKIDFLAKSNSKKTNKYEKSNLQELTMKLINDKLTYAMTQDRLFLNPTLSLSELSTHFKIPSHHITQTLNSFTKQSFYNFVNHYRVEEFKEKVFAPQNNSFSLLGIAFDCGFNSKSSFNRIFKNHTGLSPSEYKNLFK